MSRTKKGTVISTKNDKTIVVSVETYKAHTKYKKRYRQSRKYHVHNPENKKFKMGDVVTIYESRPISKLKKWTITAETTATPEPKQKQALEAVTSQTSEPTPLPTEQ